MTWADVAPGLVPEPLWAEPPAGREHPDVAVVPDEPAVRVAAVPVAPELLPPLVGVPVPVGVPLPSVPEPPDDCPPVSTVELT